MTLSPCPCGSGEYYEKCCYKTKGEDGMPLFFKGAMTCDGEGNWHPIPNIRFMMTLVGESSDKHRLFAKGLLKKSGLRDQFHGEFINLFGAFNSSKEKLISAIMETQGKGAAFQTDSLEVRTNWSQYLMYGRKLLDFIGLHTRIALDLSNEIGGLNEKKYINLLNVLESKSAHDIRFLDIRKSVFEQMDVILDFIKMRNEEKISSNTIISFPAVDVDFGVVEDGDVGWSGKTFKMNEFIQNSYQSIFNLTKILLDIS